jgi:hypothetical protein
MNPENSYFLGFNIICVQLHNILYGQIRYLKSLNPNMHINKFVLHILF